MEFSEKFLYHIWDAQHLKDNLQTISRKTIKILYPGRWNTDAGADFKDAILEIDGEVQRGDVEIELRSYNWHLHEHHENPGFNSVLLQVVFEHDGQYPYNFTENGEKIEILQVSEQLDADIKKLIKKYSGKDFKAKNKECNLFKNITDEKLIDKISVLGMERFEKKIKRFSAEHFFADFDQLIYQGLFESLGYSKNKFQMLQIALKLPFKLLKEFHLKGMTYDDLISIYLVSSGLSTHLSSSFPTELKTKWQENFGKQEFIQDGFDPGWKLFRIRPANHPAIRIIQISQIIYDSLETSLFNRIMKLFSYSSDKFTLTNFRKNLYVFFSQAPVFLPERYNLGKIRLDTILINIILPLAVIYSREKGYAELEETVFNIYSSYPGLTGNYITNFMEKYLTDSQRKLPKKAVFQQGIIKLYYDNCQFHDCENCI
ncbi:MAG: DUF2851 family protein [Candidatus Cloacimonadales bacterium]|nr:DUF2851 family protein [Candidatus Cloacimonadales bacterium]